MNKAFDTESINHMVTAISHEMCKPGSKPSPQADTLFIGGPLPSDDEQTALAKFGLSKNWKVVYPAFDPADAMRGPVTFHVVVTDGLTESLVVQHGRLWKRDRKTPAILVFADAGLIIKVNSKGRLFVRAMTDRHHDHGYDLALKAVTERAGRQRGGVAVMTSIGMLPTVTDITTMNLMFASAE